MADFAIDPNLPPEIFAEQQRLASRKRIADMLLQRGMTPIQSSNPRAPVSWTQGLAQMLAAYKGGQGLQEVEQGQAALGQQYQKGLADEVKRISALRQGRTILPDPQEVEQASDQGTPEPRPTTTGDPKAAIEAALVSQYAPVRQMGALEHKTFENEQTRANDRDARLQERILALDAAASNQAAAREDRKRAADEAASLRRELASSQQRFQADQNRQSREFQDEQRRRDREARRELAMDRIEAQRKDKLDAAQGKTDEAKQRVSVNLKALGDYYEELTKLGASIDTTKSGAKNVSARVRASGVGQLLGGALGTEEQSYRNKINQMRPLLLQEIRQATAMGARGLDSNKELEFYIQAATDPARDIQSNRAALQVLENAYGLSSRIEGVDQKKLDALKNEFKGSAGGGQANQQPVIVDW
jgi:hypothetical protein